MGLPHRLGVPGVRADFRGAGGGQGVGERHPADRPGERVHDNEAFTGEERAVPRPCRSPPAHAGPGLASLRK